MSEKIRTFKVKERVLKRIDALINSYDEGRLCCVTTPITESKDPYVQELLELIDSGDNNLALDYIYNVININFSYKHNDRDLKKRAVYMPLFLAKVFIRELYPNDIIINYEERFKNMSANYKGIPYLSVTIPYMHKSARTKLELH